MADNLTPLERRNELFVCNYEGCNKRFKRKDRLKIHSRTHTGERPYMCTHPGCERCYCRLAHLVRHQQNAHTKVEDMVKFSCTESNCSKSFLTKFGLQRHIKTEHSREAELKYKCDFDGCGHSFRKRHLLQKHINSTHSMFDPYTCSYPGCSRTFKWPNLLRKHIKTHEGYICNVDGCSKTFDTWTLLSSHKRTDHSQEFACGVCGMTFPKKPQLKSHQKMHTDLRTPFPCPYDGCGRLYLEKRNLKMHLRRFHEKQRFACTHPGCNKTFASKQKLQHHGLLHDPNRLVPVKTEKRNPLKRHKRHYRKPIKCKHSFVSILTGLRDGQMTVQDIGCPPLKCNNQNHLGNFVDDRFESVNFPNQSLEKGFGIKISVFATTEVPKKDIKSKLETHMPFCQNSSITQEACVSNGKDISNIPGDRDMAEERNDVQNMQGMMSGTSASYQKELTVTESSGERDKIADALLELKREITGKENSGYNGGDEMADVSLDLNREMTEKENSGYNGKDMISDLAIGLKQTVKKMTEEESHDSNGKNVMSDIAVDIKKEKDMTEKESIYYEGRDMMSEVIIDFQEENKEMTEKEFICNNGRDVILMS